MNCRYCGDTGLSIYATADMVRVICNVCDTGRRLQEVLKLLASAQPKEPEKVAEVIEKLKRIVEA